MTVPAPPSTGEFARPVFTGVSLGCRAPSHSCPSYRIIAMMSPEDSWVSKWQRISEWVSGGRDPFSSANPSLGQRELLLGLQRGSLLPMRGHHLWQRLPGCCHTWLLPCR